MIGLALDPILVAAPASDEFVWAKPQVRRPACRAGRRRWWQGTSIILHSASHASSIDAGRGCGPVLGNWGHSCPQCGVTQEAAGLRHNGAGCDSTVHHRRGRRPHHSDQPQAWRVSSCNSPRHHDYRRDRDPDDGVGGVAKLMARRASSRSSSFTMSIRPFGQRQNHFTA